MRQPVRPTKQNGFTILELMIATTVFGVLLMILTFATIFITKQFYSGLTQARTQQVARTIVDQISRSIQFSSGTVTDTDPDATYAGLVCAADRGFNYILFQQLTEPPIDASRHQVNRVTSVASGAGSCNRQPLNGLVGDELLGNGMRLTKLDVAPVAGTNGAWSITVRVVYGDDDLLTDSTDPIDPNVSCKSGAGSQFCATSELTVTVFKRR